MNFISFEITECVDQQLKQHNKCFCRRRRYPSFLGVYGKRTSNQQPKYPQTALSMQVAPRSTQQPKYPQTALSMQVAPRSTQQPKYPQTALSMQLAPRSAQQPKYPQTALSMAGAALHPATKVLP
jgi:hypothetical protein